MPNVMGREFPYTPEGMAAAEQYKQATGMRDGGMMGFRPIGYAMGSQAVPVGSEAEAPMQLAGGPQVTPEAMAVFQGLVDMTRRGSTQDVSDYINSNFNELNALTTMLPEGQAAFVERVLGQFATQSQQAPAVNLGGQGDAPFTGVLPEMRMPPEGGDQLLIRPPQEPIPQGVQPFRSGGIASLRPY
jgi:hypothetical protein